MAGSKGHWQNGEFVPGASTDSLLDRYAAAKEGFYNATQARDFEASARFSEEMVATRRELYQRGITNATEAAMGRGANVKALLKRRADIDRRLTKAGQARSNTRASATTKSANLGNLAAQRDAIDAALRAAGYE
jgi:hypothetical protein